MPHLQVAVFTAGVVMLLNIWGAKKSGLNVEPAKQMEDVQKCMQVLATVEDKYVYIVASQRLLIFYGLDGTLPVNYGLYNI